MPKLPSATDLGARPVPQGGAGITGYATPDTGSVGRIVEGAGHSVEGAGRVLRTTGGQLESAGDELFKAYKVEQDKFDAIRAEDAYSKLRERQLELTVGEQAGFTRVRAANATKPGFYQDYDQRFKDAAKAIDEGLDNDEQRQKFRLRAQASALQYRENLLQHIAREGDVYAKEVFDGTIKTETRLATAEWQNPRSVDAALMRIGASVDEAAKRFGWAKEYTDAQRQQAFGAVHSAVIGQALASHDFKYAKEWYDANRADVDANTAKALESKIYDETQKGLSAGYREQFLGIRNNAQAIDKLVGTIMADKELDDTRRVTIVGPMMTRSEQLKNEAWRAQQAAENRAERERTRTEKIVEQGLAKMDADIRAGYEPDPKGLEPLLASVKGNPYLTSLVERTQQLSTATRSFRLATPIEQEAMITRAESEMRAHPNRFDRQVLDAWKQIYSSQQRAVREDMVTFAVRQGILDPTSDAGRPLDLTNPAKIGPQLEARMAATTDIGMRYGVPAKPLSREETDLLRASLDRAKPESKAQYFGQLRANSKPETYMAVMGQLAPDDPVTAIAGAKEGQGYSAVASLLVRGQAIMSPKKDADGQPIGGKLIALPPDAEFEREFTRRAGNAFAAKPEARSGHLQAFRAAYAALASDRGGETGTKVIDTGLAEQAFQKVVGGVNNWNGRDVVLPYGYTYGQFKDGLKLRIGELVDAGMIDQNQAARIWSDMPLVSKGDGRYQVVGGDGQVVDKNGNKIFFDFNTTPFVTSGGNKWEPSRIVPPTDADKRYNAWLRGAGK